MQAISSETYDFSAKPKLVQARSKYRDQESDENDGKLNNLMFEKRVVRGNTYARVVTSRDTEIVNSNNKSNNKSLTKKSPVQLLKEQVQTNKDQFEPGTPKAVKGRQHIDMMTDEFVETLTDKPPEYEKDTQTEVFIDRPNARLFVPQKNGIDCETQILYGDLFDFDYEVEPILQVLIGKTLECSRMEVLEEEELRIMKEQQKTFEQIRNVELAEVQRLEAKEKRIFDESERRDIQYQKTKSLNILSHQKLIARNISKNYLQKLKQNISDILEDQGIFRNPLEMCLYDQFLPWMYQSIYQELIQVDKISQHLDEFYQEMIENNKEIHKKNYNNQIIKKQQLVEDNIQKQRELEEKNQRKKQEKLRKIEQERINKLLEQIVAKILPKAELKNNILQQIFSDIDGAQQYRPFIGLFGGLIGEFLLFLQALTLCSDQEVVQQASILLLNPEALKENFKSILNSIEGTIDMPIDQQVESILTQKEINLSNIFTVDSSIQDELIQLLNINFSSIILNVIRFNEPNFGIPEKSVDLLINYTLSLMFKEELFQQKVKFQYVKNEQKSKSVGIAKIKPNVANLPLNALSSRFNNNEEEQPSPINLAESEFENKVSVFVNKDEQLEVFVQHCIAEQVIRGLILKNCLKNIEGKEFNLLCESNSIMDNIQQKVKNCWDDLPIFDINSY